MSVRRRVLAVSCLAVAVAGPVVIPAAVAEPIPPVSEWSDPLPISAAGGAAISPRVGMDSAGNATATWLQDTDATATVKNAIFAAYRPAGGAWGTPAQVSNDGANIDSYAFAEGPTGQAIVVWRQHDGAMFRLRVSHRPAGGDQPWTTAAYLYDDASITLPSFNVDAEVGVDGTIYLVWSGQDAENENEIYFARRSVAGNWDFQILSDGIGTIADDNSSRPDIAASSAGQWLAIWRTVSPAGAVIQIKGSLANGSTSSATTVASDGAPDFPRVWGDPGGGFVRSWEEQHPDTEEDLLRVIGLDDDTSGEGDTLLYNSPDDDGASASDTAFHNGRAVLMMKMVDAAVNTYMRVTTRQDGGDWTAPVEPLDARNSVVEGELAVDAGGTYTVAFRQGASPYRARVAQLAPGQTDWTMVQSLSDHAGNTDHATNVRVAAGPADSTLVVWQQSVAGVPRVFSSHVTSVDSPPPTVSMTKPTSARTASLSIPVAWTGSSSGASIATYGVRYRKLPWHTNTDDGDFWLVGSTQTSGTFSATAGATYCFSAFATDTLGNFGPWSPERCTTTPVDDRSLSRSNGWSLVTQTGNFLNTIVKTRTKGATLRLNGAVARSLALLVQKRSSGGSVKVTFNGQALGTYSLKGTSKKKVVIPVNTFGSVTAGDLVIKVVSATGKDVIIDGVFINK